ncbi:multifunctional protein ADE2 [Nilaparvata lugens]|uniref:multifunctional protein ADE2 n=1 Tax=Nilaparvata lugens TaxID=108931 RepID=UPI000B97E390|nr:multifunctional protein ADE2 [Nilaparvata lugens]
MTTLTEGGGYKFKSLIIEGKTKQVYELVDRPDECAVVSKDRITAGDGARAHDLKGKSQISNRTTCKIFQLLSTAGIKTSFVREASENIFIARKCAMVPIEWITRRIATGSFLKRHPGVPEHFRFNPPKQETCFKDDENHDPIWSQEQIISANFKLNGLVIGRDEVEIMRRTALLVFEVLEKAWASRDCTLVDMKIEFGVDAKGEMLVSDVIDSDSWRLWPAGDKSQMKDKQVYRNLTTVTQADLDTVKRNFTWVADQLEFLIPPTTGRVAVFMGSPSDEEHCRKIKKECKALSIPCDLRVSSAHKGTEETLNILAEYEGSGEPVVLVAVAGRSNGLGPVLSGNSVLPVINCPPVNSSNVTQDIWSSLNVPSGLACTTVIYPAAAAQAAAQILALSNHMVWARLRAQALNNYISLKKADKAMRDTKE